MAMRLRRWMWAAVLAGCAAKKPETRPPAAQTPVEAQAKAQDPELLAIADAIDPGPQRPLFEGLPKPLRDKLGAPRDGTTAVREIREALMAWEKLRTSDAQAFVLALLNVGRGLVLAEQAVARGEDDPELLLALGQAYAILGTPAFASERGMFQQILQLMATLASQHLQEQEVGFDVAALVGLLRDVFQRAPALHQRTAAELLRRHGDHPEIPRVLGRLSDKEMDGERYEQALKLRQMAVARLGERARGGDWLDMSYTCFRALQPTCGDEALARGKALGSDKPDDAKAAAAYKARVEKLEETAGRAKRALALAEDPRVKDVGDADLTPALERGQLLILLGRYADARAQYERLMAAHPGDARPYAGLAKVALADGGDLKASAEWAEKGRKLANRDRDYYEVALGVFGSKMLTEVMPSVMKDPSKTPQGVLKSLLDDMKEYATGLQPFAPAQAGVVLALEAVARVAAPLIDDKTAKLGQVVTRDLVARTQELYKKFPDSPDVRRMMFLGAKTAESPETALALAKAPLVGELMNDPALQRARIQAWLDVAIQRDETGELPAILAALAATPTVADDWQKTLLTAVARAMQLRVGNDRAAGTAALADFEAVAASEAPAETRQAALCNSGVLLAWLGDDEGARARFEQALEKFPGSRCALVAIAGLYTKHGVQEPKLAEIFEVVGREGDSHSLRVHALAWRYTQAKAGLGDVEVTRKAFLDEVEKERKAGSLVSQAVDLWGVYSSGSWNMSLQYHSTSGFKIINELSSTTWLTLPSPDLKELVAAGEAKQGKQGKADKKKPAK